MNRVAIVGMTAFLMLIGISVTIVTFQKCGWKTFLLGNSAPVAAMMGLCDE
jgi:hypothetical protein